MRDDLLIPLGDGGELAPDSVMTDEFLTLGCIAQRLPYPVLNSLHNRSDTAANDAREGRALFTRGSNRGVELLEGWRSTSHIGWAGNDLNKINLGSTADIPNNICYAVIEGRRSILVANHNLTEQIQVIDIEDLTIRTVTLGDLPAGAWHPQGICADKDYVYVAYLDSTDYVAQRLQCYQLGAGSTWARRTSWPATGVSLISAGGFRGPGRLILANSSYVAFGRAEVSGTYPIQLVTRSDGGTSILCKGDLSSAGTSKVESLVSNGRYLFYVCAGKVASIDLSAPAIGCGGTGWPLNAGGEPEARTLCLGDLVLYSKAVTDPTIYAAHTSRSVFGTIDLSGLCDGVLGLGSDSFNVWARCLRTVGGTQKQVIIKVPYHALTPESTSIAGSIAPDNLDLIATFDPYTVHPIPTSNEEGWVNMVSDGRDLWFGGSGLAGTTMSGIVYRIPFATWR